jgi:DNA-directed RNA polymerase II subunit RPB2
MVKSMTLLCTLSTSTPAAKIDAFFAAVPAFIPVHLIHPVRWDPIWTKVFINSNLVGVLGSGAESVYAALARERRSGAVSQNVSISWDRLHNELSIFTDAGRPMRPVYRAGVTQPQVDATAKWTDMQQKLFDYLDAQETETTRISMDAFSPQLPSEIHGSVIFSASGSVIPNPDFNQGPRNMFSCQQAKQACSWFNTAFHKRFDTIATILNYAQRPLSTTWTFPHITGCLPYGENAIVALSIYSGYNQEDSILLNDSALRRGLFQTTYYHSYDVLEKAIDMALDTHTEFGNPAENPRFKDAVKLKEGYDYSLLDADGIITRGAHVTDKTILVGIVSPITSASGQVTGHADVSYAPKRGQHGIIDAVHRFTTADGLYGVKIRIAEIRSPVLGDKFAARHGQKGTVGFRLAEEDMPYTASGLRPDMIVNPHAFPSRMTIGQFVESMSTKLGLHLGCGVDSTAFSTQNRVEEMRTLLEKAGFHPQGHEMLYNGHTGELMESEIFMGPTYYLRLKHMVEDKINYRSTGPKTLLTHQPLEGRANDGGLRIGEMERDGLIAHGVSKFLHESMMDRSDGSETLYRPDTGMLDARPNAPVTTLSMPHAMTVLAKEIEAMHVSMKMVSSLP